MDGKEVILKIFKYFDWMWMWFNGGSGRTNQKWLPGCIIENRITILIQYTDPIYKSNASSDRVKINLC